MNRNGVLKKREVKIEVEEQVERKHEPYRIDSFKGTHCWYCTLAIEGDVWALPLKKRKDVTYKRFFTEEKKVEIFRMNETCGEGTMFEGSFCCPSCILAYIYNANAENAVRYRESCSNLLTMLNVTTLQPSPDYRLLKKFGGSLTEEEYKTLRGENKFLVSYSHFDCPMSIVCCEN